VKQPKWLLIARNEYLASTSRIRRVRPFFPYLITGFLLLYVVYVAPAFVGFFLDEFLSVIVSQVAVALVQIIMFLIFFYFILIPISTTLREDESRQIEVLLAAPIKASDVLLGEFVGKWPIYIIATTVVAGVFTALLSPIGLDYIQLTIIIVVIVLTFLLASWIGHLTASLLRTKLSKTARGRDIGRALSMVLALPFVAAILALNYGGVFESLTSNESGNAVSFVLGFFPSSWGANIIVDFSLNPGNFFAVGFKTLLRFSGLVLFFVGSIWFGVRIADRAYSLEPTTFISDLAKADGLFYKSVYFVGGRKSFGTILVTVFKDYSRRLENLTNVSYIVGVIILMNFFTASNYSSPDNPPVSLLMIQFMLPVSIVMIVGELTVKGKETLFVYRKTPFGEKRYVYAKFLHSLMMVLPITAALIALPMFFDPYTTYFSFITNIGMMLWIISGNVAFVIGLFCVNPAFSEKDMKLKLNVIIAVLVPVSLFIFSLVMFIGANLDFTGYLFSVQLIQGILTWVVGIVFLYFGVIRLKKIE